MVPQGFPLGVILHGQECLRVLLVSKVHLEDGVVRTGDDLPQPPGEGIDIVPVHVDGAQKIEGVPIALGPPEKALGARAAAVVKMQHQPLRHDQRLLKRAGALQRQVPCLSPAQQHPHLHQAVHRVRIRFHLREIPDRRLPVEGVDDSAPGGVDRRRRRRRTGGGLQQRQTVGHYGPDPLQLFVRDLLQNAVGPVRLPQPQCQRLIHGVARPRGDGRRLRLRRPCG